MKGLAEMKQTSNKTYKWCEWGPVIIQIITCLGLYIAVLIAFILTYKVPSTTNSTENIWDVLHSELVNWATLLPIAGPLFADRIIKKISPNYPSWCRIVWASLLALLICFYRIAIDMEIHRVPIALCGMGHFVVTVILALVFDKSHVHGFSQNSNLLAEALGKQVKNNSILSVQLFECVQRPTQSSRLRFSLENKAWVVNKQSEDVNSILALSLELPEEDFEQFEFSLAVFDKMVDEGADTEKKKSFCEAIKKKKEDLVKRLSRKQPDSITREDSCLARLLVCYNMLEQMVEKPSQAVLDFDDGVLGLDTELERRLFSTLRTGMLGAILFGVQRRYYFRYRREGIKAGRKYCAFIIDSNKDQENNSERKLICLVTIRESDTNEISADIIEWIMRTENKITRQYNKVVKGE